MQLEIGAILAIGGFIVAVGGFIIGYLTFNRNRDKDVKKDATHDAIISEKLSNISTGVDEIRLDMKASDRRISELSEQLIRTDESAKSAHKRIDGIEKECAK